MSKSNDDKNKLRYLLDKRGVKHHDYKNATSWRGTCGESVIAYVVYGDASDQFVVKHSTLTAEQAIAATLGGRTLTAHDVWEAIGNHGVSQLQAIADELNAALGSEDTSRWHELFGTPERAAQTLTNVCQFTHGGELCDRCQCYLFDDCDRKLRLMSEQSIYGALLEWLRLRGDAK